MMMITRYPDETIVIHVRGGVDIVVRVVSVRGDKVRVGIDAPDHVEVRRGELVDEAGVSKP